MKFSISNIAWDQNQDICMYEKMRQYGFEGLEIAPTRIFASRPYEKIDQAKQWRKEITEKYGLMVSSMQSIWYGRQEKLFGSEQERNFLMDYSKKIVDFAEAVDCKNIVFGCPKNRSIPDGGHPEGAVKFFRKWAEYAVSKHTVIGIEANPPIYNTNYINDTESALHLLKEVNSEGFKLNLDVGTMIQNQEDIAMLEGKVHNISHVHISEPGLRPIEERKIHTQLRDILSNENYQGFISIEMGKREKISVITEKMNYVRNVFS